MVINVIYFICNCLGVDQCELAPWLSPKLAKFGRVIKLRRKANSLMS